MAFIGIDRGIVNHWIYEDAEYFKVWFEMLYRARYSQEPETKLIDGILVEMNYGEFIYGRTKWSERLKVSERRLRTLIDKLQRDNMIESVTKFPRFTVYRIINYAKYNQQNDQQEDQAQQGIPDIDDHPNDQRPTSRRPSGDQRATIKEQSNNKDNNGKKVVTKIKYAEKVELSVEQYERLIEKYGSEEATKWAIEKLNNYKHSKKTKYTSDYHVLIGWVYEDFEKRRLTLIKGGITNAKHGTGHAGRTDAELDAMSF